MRALPVKAPNIIYIYIYNIAQKDPESITMWTDHALEMRFIDMESWSPKEAFSSFS